MVGDIVASVCSTRENSLLCDGSLIPSGSEYDALRALVGVNTPDLRDMFLRGCRDGRSILSYEADGNKSHSHSYSIATKMKQSASGTVIDNISGNRSATTSVDGNSEVTVKNRAVNYFIVYKEVVTLTQSDFDLFVSSCPSIAKKSDLQFTDIHGCVWDLMDLITANLPFRNV